MGALRACPSSTCSCRGGRVCARAARNVRCTWDRLQQLGTLVVRSDLACLANLGLATL